MDKLRARDDLNKTLGKDEVMKKQLKAIIVCVVCTSVLFTAGAIAKEPGVLERVKTVDDRELGELIRIAIDNLLETKELKRCSGRRLSSSGISREKYAELKNEHAKLKLELQGAEEIAIAKVIRSVTEVYAQIKLLDTQIEQTRIKMDSLSSSDAIYTELALAIAELGAKRSTQLAQLRQIMNIVPKYAFGHKSAKTLKGWLILEVIGDQVYTFKALRPFRESDTITGNPRYRRISKTEIIKEMSKKEAVGYIKNYIKDKNKHPFRIDITRTTAGKKLSKELYDDIVRTIEAEKLELESVVYLHINVHEKSHSAYYFKDGKIYSQSDRRYLISGSEQEYIDEYVWRLKDPKYLPHTYMLEFDEEGEELANRINDAILLKAKELKVEKLIETKRVLCFDIYVDGHRIYNSLAESRDSNSKFIDEEDFIKQTVPEQLKRAKKLPIKYIISCPNRNTNLERLKEAIKTAAKEASVQDMVEIE